MKTIDEQLQVLTQSYGKEIIMNACRKLLTNSGERQEIEFNVNAVALSTAFEQFNTGALGLVDVAQLFVEGVHQLGAVVRESNKLPAIPTQYAMLLSPGMIMETIDQLEGSITDNMNRADVYGEKGPLLRKKSLLENAIKLTEATAIMTPEFAPLKNDTLRDAFRREASKVERTQLAEVDGQIFEIDVAVAKERDARQSLIVATESAHRKAALQTSMLNFLAGGRV